MEGKMRIYYDEEGDYLTIFIGESKSNYGEDIEEDVTLFKDQKTDEIIGIGILNFREHTKDLKDILVNVPIKINFEAIRT